MNIIINIFIIISIIISNIAIADFYISKKFYDSKIFSGNRVTSGETVFYYDEYGSLNGQYSFDENGAKVNGTINDCKLIEKKYICKWRDKYGKGIIEIYFLEKNDEFLGYWNIENSTPQFRWSGKVKLTD